jgi:hypothetical protein
MTALYISITEPNKISIDNLCREDATEIEKKLVDLIEEYLSKTILEKSEWEIHRG